MHGGCLGWLGVGPLNLHQQERHLDFHPSCLPSQQQSSAPHLLEAKDLAKVHLVGVNALANKDKTTSLGSQPKHSFGLEHRMPLVGCVPFALDLLLGAGLSSLLAAGSGWLGGSEACLVPIRWKATQPAQIKDGAIYQ